MWVKRVVVAAVLGSLCFGAVALADGGKVKKAEMVIKRVQTGPDGLSGKLRTKGNQSRWAESCMFRGHKVVLQSVKNGSKERVAKGQASGTGFFQFGKLDAGKYQVIGPKVKVKNGYGSGQVVCKKAKSDVVKVG